MPLRRSRSQPDSVFEQEALVHLGALHRYAVQLCRDPSEAEDLVQETLLKAFRYFDRYEPGTRCKAWLFRILTNTFLNSRRARVRQFPLLDNVDAAEPDASELIAWSEFYADPERRATSRSLRDVVDAALEELPEDFRTVVLLADLEGFAYKEIADIMECPVGTVMSRLHRARKALQQRLGRVARAEGWLPRSAAPADPAGDGSAAAGPASLVAFRAQRQGAPRHANLTKRDDER